MDYKKIWELVKFHGGIALKGFIRTIYGALVAGLVACAVYGFINIGGEAGYAAVCDFIVSTAAMFIALVNVYAMGGKRGAKK